MLIEDKFYTTKEIAIILRCCIPTIRRYIKEGKIKGWIYSGKQYLIPKESIEKYLRDHNPESLF